MKKILYILALSAAFLFISCDRDPLGGGEDLPMPPQEEEKVFFEIISDENHEMTAFIDQMLQSAGSGLASYKGLIISQVERLLDTIRESHGLADEEIGFRKVAYKYESEDLWGNVAVLSAAVFWLGYYSGDAWNDILPDQLCLMEHYTLTANSDCPSEGCPLELFASGNTLMIMPDYLGFGASSSYVHPYMIHELCAVNSIDAIPAGKEVFAELAGMEPDEEWLFSAKGASQGGGNALAVHRYMDTHPELAEEWNFTGSYCAAGPYRPSLTVDKYIEAGKTDAPVLFPLTLVSMRNAYPEVFGCLDESRIYSAKYMACKDQIETALESREYTVAQMNSLMCGLLKDNDDAGTGLKELALTDILSEEMTDRNSEVCKAFYECLADNDLTVGWVPVRPVRLYYSTADKTVPYENSIAVGDAFGTSSVTLEKGFAVDHTTCCALWMLNVLRESYL